MKVRESRFIPASIEASSAPRFHDFKSTPEPQGQPVNHLSSPLWPQSFLVVFAGIAIAAPPSPPISKDVTVAGAPKGEDTSPNDASPAESFRYNCTDSERFRECVTYYDAKCNSQGSVKSGLQAYCGTPMCRCESTATCNPWQCGRDTFNSPEAGGKNERSDVESEMKMEEEGK